MRKGGYGLSSYGRSEYGNGRSRIEPRFDTSRPVNHETHVRLDRFLKFSTYCFSSWLDLSDLIIEISEDSGASFNIAYSGGVFVAPYAGVNSKVFRPNSQQLCTIIQKTDLWTDNARIVIRFVGTDEFEQAATSVIPVHWSA